MTAQRLGIAASVCLVFPEDEQIEKLQLGRNVVGQLAKLLLRDLAPEAFAESKRMRTGRFCADVREQMSARVAHQVEIWHSAEAQTRLRTAAKRLAR